MTKPKRSQHELSDTQIGVLAAAIMHAWPNAEGALIVSVSKQSFIDSIHIGECEAIMSDKASYETGKTLAAIKILLEQVIECVPEVIAKAEEAIDEKRG